MEANCFLLLLAAFIAGCAFIAFIFKFFNEDKDKRNERGLPFLRDEPRQYQTSVLFLPDGKLPCWNFNDYLLGTSSRCHCDRSRGADYVHTDEPETTLVKILKKVSRARSSIELCMNLFTIEESAKLLVQLNKRRPNLTIRVICDVGRKKYRERDRIPYLIKEGIQVREHPDDHEKDYRPLMHHKFVIIDKKLAFTGSSNWTDQAVKKNNESVIMTDEPEVVRRLVREFEQLWRRFKPPTDDTGAAGNPSDLSIEMPSLPAS